MHNHSYLGAAVKPLDELVDQIKRRHKMSIMNEKHKEIGSIDAEIQFIHSKTKLFQYVKQKLESEKEDVNLELEDAMKGLVGLRQPFPGIDVKSL